MKHLTLLLMMLVSARAEQLPDTSGDQNTPAVPALDAERFVGREVTITGRPVCADFIDHSLKYGLLNLQKKPLFRVVVRIPGVDADAYIRKLYDGPSFTVRGRIEWDPPHEAVTFGWAWTGGPQMVVTTLEQIHVVSPSK